MSPIPDAPTATDLLPDPERIRARLAELAREQAVLRQALRAMVRWHWPHPTTAPDRKQEAPPHA